MDGWNVTLLNVSESSISFQWQKLTDVLGNQVRAYIPIVETTDGKEITGDIVFPNVTSKTTHELLGNTEYRIFTIVVDELGQPRRSSEVLVFTDEGGKCEKERSNTWCTVFLYKNNITTE